MLRAMTDQRAIFSTHRANRVAAQPPFYSELAVIALGGAFGTTLRHAVSVFITFAHWHFVYATAVANLLGSLLLGLFVGYLVTGAPHPLLRPFLTVGVFGSFTTFSVLAMDNRLLAAESSELTATIHLGLSVASGLTAFVLAERLSARLFRRGQR
jgi:CrcB protein